MYLYIYLFSDSDIDLFNMTLIVLLWSELVELTYAFQGGTSFVDLLCFFCLMFAIFLCASVYMCFVVTCWERAGLLALVCGVWLWICHFPIGILGQVWYLIVSFLIFALLLTLYIYIAMCKLLFLYRK